MKQTRQHPETSEGHSNSTTIRLEAYARKHRLKGFGVLKYRGDPTGVFFCVQVDGAILERRIALGRTQAEAKEGIERLATVGTSVVLKAARALSR